MNKEVLDILLKNEYVVLTHVPDDTGQKSCLTHIPKNTDHETYFMQQNFIKGDEQTPDVVNIEWDYLDKTHSIAIKCPVYAQRAFAWYVVLQECMNVQYPVDLLCFRRPETDELCQAGIFFSEYIPHNLNHEDKRIENELAPLAQELFYAILADNQEELIRVYKVGASKNLVDGLLAIHTIFNCYETPEIPLETTNNDKKTENPVDE
jgi:hypothetical protein